MFNLSKVYKSLSHFFNVNIEDDGTISNDHTVVSFPMVIDNKATLPFTVDMLEAVANNTFDANDLEPDTAYFYPFVEDHGQGKSQVYTSLELTTRVKANVKAWLVMDVFLELAVTPKRHKKAPPIAKRMLAELGKVDTKTYELFQRMRNTTDLMTKGLLLTTAVQYHFEVDGKSYERVGTLRSDFRADLVDGEKKVLGVTVARKMDREALIKLFDLVMPNFETNKATFPVSSRNAPNLQALVSIGKYVDEVFSKLGTDFAKLFDADALAVLQETVDIELSDIDEAAVLSRSINVPYNAGIPKAGTATRIAGVSSKPAVVENEPVADRGSRQVKNKANKMNQPKNNAQRYLAALGGNRPSPKSGRSSVNNNPRNNHNGMVWVSNSSYDAGGYWLEEDDNGRGAPRSNNRGNSNGGRQSLADRMLGRGNQSRFADNNGRGSVRGGGRGSSRGGQSRGGQSRGGQTRGTNRRSSDNDLVCTLNVDGENWDFFMNDVRGTGNDAYLNVNGVKHYLDDLGVELPSRNGSRRTNNRTNNRNSRNNRVVLTLDDNGQMIDFYEDDIISDNQGDYIEYNGETYDID